MRQVHYLCRRPGAERELVYPQEMPPGHQSPGSFFLPGNPEKGVDEEYEFYAYRGGEVVAIPARKSDRDSLVAIVDGIGGFQFLTSLAGIPARYVGNLPFPDQGMVARQLAPIDREELERAARDKDFFFVGYSPRLDEYDVPKIKQG